jgi:hypothetical protein
MRYIWNLLLDNRDQQTRHTFVDQQCIGTALHGLEKENVTRQNEKTICKNVRNSDFTAAASLGWSTVPQ